MGKFGRGAAFNILGQGITQFGGILGQGLLEKQKQDEERPFKNLQAAAYKQQIATGERETAQATETENLKNRLAEYVKQFGQEKGTIKFLGEGDNYDKIESLGIKIQGEGAAEPETQYKPQAWPELGETEQPVQQPAQQPVQKPEEKQPSKTRALYEGISRDVPQALVSSDAGIKSYIEGLRGDIEKEEQRDYGKMIVELQMAGILTPQEKEDLEDRKRQKDLESEKEIAKYRAGLKPEGDNWYNKREQVKYKAGVVDAETEKAISGVYEASSLLSGVIGQYKTTSKGVGSIAGETVAKVPLAGKYIAPKSKEYDSSKKIVSEVFLRAATGAAAPDHEVTRYASFLPDLSDPQELAQKKLDNFKTKVMAKAGARVKALNAAGDALIATGKENYIEIGETKKAMAQSFMESLERELTTLPNIIEKKSGGEPAKPVTEEEDELDKILYRK